MKRLLHFVCIFKVVDCEVEKDCKVEKGLKIRK